MRKILRLVAVTISAFLVQVGFVPIASASGSSLNLTPGPSSAITITTTAPDFTGGFKVIGPDWQISQIYIQLVKKTAAADPNPSWYWVAPDAADIVSPDFRGFCTSQASCETLGWFKVSVTRGGNPVAYRPWYFASTNNPRTEANRVAIQVSDQATPPAGWLGIQTGDQISITFTEGFFTFPNVTLADYEFRFVYLFTGVGTNNGNGPQRKFSTGTQAAATLLSNGVAPTATSIVGGARVQITPYTPTPGKYVITASPQVNGVTKTCTVTPPATTCNVTGLDAGTSYTFTSQIFPLGDIGSEISPISNSVTPLATPTITGVSPTSGLVDGGTAITITGTNFQSGATVTIGGNACTNVVVVSSTSITCSTPAGQQGAANVVVTSSGLSATAVGGFTYAAVSSPSSAPSRPYEGPLNLKIQPGTLCSGSDVLVTGSRLDTIADVYFGDKKVPHVLTSEGQLRLSLKDIVEGLHQVKFWVPASSVNLTDQIRVGACSSFASAAGPGPFSVSKLFANYLGDRGPVVSRDLAAIRAFINQYPGITDVRCVGSTSGVPAKRTDQALATARAKNACDAIAKLLPGAKITLETSTGKGVGQRFRSVQVFVTGTR